MAKATAICTCATCGDTFRKEKACYNRREADEFEAWAVDNITECPSCYGKRMAEAEKAEGLRFTIRLNHDYHAPYVSFVLFGDTMPIKDDIKAMRYLWSSEYPEGNSMLDLLSIREPKKRWNKIVPADGEKIAAEMKALSDKGFTPFDIPSANVIAEHIVRLENAAKRREEKIQHDLGPKPEYPDAIRAKWPEGYTWNGKVYGRSGSYCVYFAPKCSRDGVKAALTDEEADAIQSIYKARAEWENRARIMR